LLIDLVEKELGRDIANIDITGTVDSAVPRDDEDDLTNLANLLCTSRFNDASPQPVLARRNGDRGEPVKMLFVGTSFLWGLTRALGQVPVLADMKVWYYFSSLFEVAGNSPHQIRPLTAEKADLTAAIGAYDVVVIEINESVLSDLGQGFVESALRSFGREPVTSLSVLPPEVLRALEIR